MRKNIYRKKLAFANDTEKKQIYRTPFEKGDAIGYTSIEMKPNLTRGLNSVAQMQSDTGVKCYIKKPCFDSDCDSNDFLFN